MKWIGGLLTIAVIMGWVATASIPAAPVSIDSASLKFLPPETQGIAFVDVAALRNATLVQNALQTATLDFQKGLANFVDGYRLGSPEGRRSDHGWKAWH